MTAINFPNNPQLNDTFTTNNTVFTWNGDSWTLTQQTYNTISQTYGSNTQNIEIDISNGNNIKIDLDTKVGSSVSFKNVPQDLSSKISLLLERNDLIGQPDLDIAKYNGEFKLYSEFLIDNIQQILISPDGVYIYFLEFGKLQSGKMSTPWDLNTVEKISEVTTFSGSDSLYFSPDGINLYITNSTGNFIDRYILNEPWNLETSQSVFPNAVEFFSPSTQGTTPTSVFFKPDGTQMYVLTASNDSVFQYELTTPWSFASGNINYSFKTFTITEDTTPKHIYIKPDGKSLFALGRTNDRIYEYILSADWDITLSGGADNQYSYASLSTTGQALFFKPDGSKMYIGEVTSDKVFIFDVENWDITTSTNTGYYSMSYYDAIPTGIFVTHDGTKMYTSGVARDYIHYFELSKPFDITTAKYKNIELYVGGVEATPYNIYVSKDGVYLFVIGISSDVIRKFIMTTPWDLTTATYLDFGNFGTGETFPTGIWFSDDGNHLYMVGSTNDTIYHYNLPNPWTLGNNVLTLTSTLSVSALANPISVVLTSDGRNLFVNNTTVNNEIIYQYSLSTPFVLSSAVFTNKTLLASDFVSGIDMIGMSVSSDGSHLYIIDAITDKAHQFKIRNGEFDLNNYTYDNVTFNSATSSGDSDVKSFQWGKDGYRLYVMGNTNKAILQYSLTSQYDLTTISAAPTGFISYSNAGVEMTGFSFNDIGNKIYIISNQNSNIYQYTLQNPWELVNSTTVYNGVSSLPSPKIYNSEAVYTSPGTYEWVCPDDVYSVSAVCVGGGAGGLSGNSFAAQAGGGGGLGWKNDIPVIPGQTYTLGVGAGGPTGGFTGLNRAGGNSYFISTSTVCGFGAPNSTGGTFVGDGGGNGGQGGFSTSVTVSSGGGGAGGYLGNGGNGAVSTNFPIAGSGGGGGGGQGSSLSNSIGANGGNVGLYGIGANGVAYSGDGSTTVSNGVAIAVGGGGRSYDADDPSETVCAGRTGGVRLVWGRGKKYPYDAYLADEEGPFFIKPHTKIQFKPDGTRMYIMGLYNNSIVEYVLTEPWNLTKIDNRRTAVFQQHFRIDVNEKNLSSFVISSNGTKLFVYGLDIDRIHQFTMPTPWDITTATYDFVVSSAFLSIPIVDIKFDFSGRKMGVLSDANNLIYQYTISDYNPTILWPENIEWENGEPPEIPTVNSSKLIDLYISDNGSRIYGTEKFINSKNT